MKLETISNIVDYAWYHERPSYQANEIVYYEQNL